MNFRLLTIFVLGLLTGGIAVSVLGVYQQRDPVLACTGRVQLDTTSPEDLRLNGAIFVDNSGAHNGRIYLRFRDDAAMNDAIGKNATLTGALKATRIDDGRYISELLVGHVEYHADHSELDTRDDEP